MIWVGKQLKFLLSSINLLDKYEYLTGEDLDYQFLLDKQSDQQQKISESTIFEQPNQRQQIQNLRS